MVLSLSDVENKPANTVVMAVTYWDLNLLDEANYLHHHISLSL